MIYLTENHEYNEKYFTFSLDKYTIFNYYVSKTLNCYRFMFCILLKTNIIHVIVLLLL